MPTSPPSHRRAIPPSALAQLALPIIGQRGGEAPSRKRLAQTPELAVGDPVIWTARGNGRCTQKRGTVHAIVPAGHRPDPAAFPTLRRRDSSGHGRATPSYLVAGTDGVLYWPIATHLQLAR